MSTTIEVSPLEITKSVEPGKQYEETLTVRNVGDERYAYQARLEETYRAWVDPDPDHFAINAHEFREVALRLEPPHDAKIGLHEFKIIVVNDDNDDDRAAVDVVLKVPIPILWWIIAGVVVVLILLVVLWQLGVFP
jgi:hypothetical protein